MVEYLKKSQRDWHDVPVLVRPDLNVPVEKGVIQDFSRIDAFMRAGSLAYLLEAGARVILLAHIGRFKKDKPVQSTEILRKPLEEQLGRPIEFIDQVVGGEVKEKAGRLAPGQVLLLGNSRFSDADEGDSQDLADWLAELCEIFVFDGFGVAHRHQASTTGVQERRETYLGHLIEEEIGRLKPFTGELAGSMAIVGGKKLKEKIGAIEGLLVNGWHVILVAVPLNVALKVSGGYIGDSLDNEEGKHYDTRMTALLERYKPQIHLPRQVVISNISDRFQSKKWDPKEQMPAGWEIVDSIPGEDMIDLLAGSSRIILAGPPGRFELGFYEGTKAVLAVMERHSCSLVLGGETAAATGFKNFSTGGGSAIYYLSNGTLPIFG